jgi:putative ATP-binding cassette transporter
LGSFWEALEQPSSQTPNSDSSRGIVTKIEPGIRFEKVTIMTPSREQTLLRDLSFELRDQSLLITGMSGCGKSSILRCVLGLWTAGTGTVARPQAQSLFFLPQRPYMVLGSFRSQFLYGQPRQSISDKLVRRVIDQAGLGETLVRVGGLEAVHDWPNLLSNGEQQRVAFARLFLAKPAVAFMDEATTALDSESEKYLYDQLRATTQMYVSVGYRLTLSEFHDYILELKGDGKWQWEKSSRGKSK